MVKRAKSEQDSQENQRENLDKAGNPTSNEMKMEKAERGFNSRVKEATIVKCEKDQTARGLESKGRMKEKENESGEELTEMKEDTEEGKKKKKTKPKKNLKSDGAKGDMRLIGSKHAETKEQIKSSKENGEGDSETVIKKDKEEEMSSSQDSRGERKVKGAFIDFFCKYTECSCVSICRFFFSSSSLDIKHASYKQYSEDC